MAALTGSLSRSSQIDSAASLSDSVIAAFIFSVGWSVFCWRIAAITNGTLLVDQAAGPVVHSSPNVTVGLDPAPTGRTTTPIFPCSRACRSGKSAAQPGGIAGVVGGFATGEGTDELGVAFCGCGFADGCAGAGADAWSQATVAPAANTRTPPSASNHLRCPGHRGIGATAGERWPSRGFILCPLALLPHTLVNATLCPKLRSCEDHPLLTSTIRT